MQQASDEKRDEQPLSESEGGRTLLRVIAPSELDARGILLFRDEAFSAIGTRPDRLLLDVSAVAEFDTAAISTLVTIVRVARMVKVAVGVLPSPSLRRLLKDTNLCRLIPASDSAPEENKAPPK